MFFTHTTRIVAILAFAFGIFRVLLGFGIATDAIGPYEAALARYAGSASSSGDVIDSGFYAIAFAIALGTLAEISFAVRKAADFAGANHSVVTPQKSKSRPLFE
jgi:hypothetical protein